MSFLPIDRTGCSPTSYRVRERAPEEVDLVVLHQTGTPPGLADDVTDRTRAHLLVLDSGEVRLLHRPLVRLRYGSAGFNRRCVTVEVRANLPGRYFRGAGRWASREVPPEAWDPDARRAQVLAVREALRWLVGEVPSIRLIGAHRQVEGRDKGGCPGPDLWRECGEWALEALGLQLVPTAPTGRDLPPEWRRAPTIPTSLGALGATVAGRAAAGGEGTGRAYDGPQEASPFAR